MDTFRSMTRRSGVLSENDGVLSFDFSLWKSDLGGCASMDSTDLVVVLDERAELILVDRTDDACDADVVGVPTGGGGPKDSSSKLKSGEGVSASDGSYTEGVVATEAIVSKDVR
jgi:hypothetical protein